MPQDHGLHVEISDELRELLRRAWTLAAEEGRGARPFVLMRSGDEESQARLPREPEDARAELDALLADLGDEVEAYAAAWPQTLDGREVLLVEAEERELGCVLRLVRVCRPDDDATDDTRLHYAGEAVLLERAANRLVAAADQDTDLIDDPVVLLLGALLCVVRADGRIDEAEVAMLEGFAATVPALARHELPELLALARQQLAAENGAAVLLRNLERLPATSADRRRLYVLACELALVTGGVCDAERAVLTHIAARLDLDAAFCAAAERVLRAKYERERPLAPGVIATTLMAVISADGAFDRAEMAAVEALAHALPELARSTTSAGGAMTLLAEAQRSLLLSGGVQSALDTIAAAVDNDAQGARALVTVAVEVALASGDLDPRETHLVDALATRLGVPDDALAEARSVFAIKYADA